jgi:hypothetical protein
MHAPPGWWIVIVIVIVIVGVGVGVGGDGDDLANGSTYAARVGRTFVLRCDTAMRP